MCLNDLRRGQYARVLDIPEEGLRMQLLRFGITHGCEVCCHTKLPMGPIVLKYGGQEIAVGHQAARTIEVACEQPARCRRRWRRAA